MEWMIIVHVTIVSGCLLASNNHSTSLGIVGGDHEALHQQPRRANTFQAVSHMVVNASHHSWKWFLLKK
jgi:hypothetical protein